MIQLTADQIREVADQMDCGFRCFYNTVTKEIKSVIDMDKHPFAEEDFWESEYDEIEKDTEKFIEIHAPDTRFSLRIMERFIDTVDDIKFQNRLIFALNRPRPFSNFKYEIDYSGEYREIWFAFKKNQFIEWVKDQIEMLNNRDEQ
jgi:hypothetical protein